MNGESVAEAELRLFKEGYRRDMEALNNSLKAWESRMQTIERLAWVATGGVIVLGAIVSIIGGNILRLLGAH